jgi:hypothetical protein
VIVGREIDNASSGRMPFGRVLHVETNVCQVNQLRQEHCSHNKSEPEATGCSDELAFHVPNVLADDHQ